MGKPKLHPNEYGLLPCPFCGSDDVDPDGWASKDDRGPACTDCGATAESASRWNTRPNAE